MTALVLSPPGLLFTNVLLDDNEEICSGWVVNGYWHYRSNGTHHFAYRARDSDLLSPVSVYPIDRPLYVVVVPDQHGGGRATKYNEAIDWARTQPPFTGSLRKLLNKAEAAHNPKGRPLSGFEDMDDDIPF